MHVKVAINIHAKTESERGEGVRRRIRGKKVRGGGQGKGGREGREEEKDGRGGGGWRGGRGGR